MALGFPEEMSSSGWDPLRRAALCGCFSDSSEHGGVLPVEHLDLLVQRRRVHVVERAPLVHLHVPANQLLAPRTPQVLNSWADILLHLPSAERLVPLSG